MFKKLLLLFMILTSLTLSAALPKRVGKAKFLSEDEDSLDFVKKQLIFNAMSDMVMREMDLLRLDGNLFWSRFEESFSSHFKPTEDALKLKFGMTEETPLEGDVLERYEKAIRQKRMINKIKYAGFISAIPSYSIRRISRSSEIRNMRFLTLDAKVNQKEVIKLYNRFTSDVNLKKFSKVYVFANYSLNGITWPDLGVNSEGEIAKVINENWFNWFNDNGKKLSDEYVLANTDQILGVRKELVNVAMQEDNPLFNARANEYFSQGLIQLNLRISNVVEDPHDKQRTLSFSMDYYVQDLSSGKILFSEDLTDKNGTFSYEKESQLASYIATFIYRLPISGFKKLSKVNILQRRRDRQILVEVDGVNSISQLEELVSSIETNTAKLKATGDLTKIVGNNATVRFSLDGNQKDFITELKKFNGKKLKNDSVVTVPKDLAQVNSSNIFRYKLNSKLVEEKVDEKL